MFKRIIYTCFIAAVLSGCQSGQKDKAHLLLISLSSRIEDGRLPDSQKIVLALQADSLAIIMGNDSLHLMLQKDIGTFYFNNGDADHARYYFLNAADVAGQRGDLTKRAVCLNNAGLAYDELYERDSALKYYIQATEIFKDQDDSLHLAQGMINIGVLYKNKGEYEKAVTACIEAAKIFDALNEKTNLSDAYSTLGNSLKSLNRLDDALSYHEQALAIRVAQKDSTGISGSLNNIANVYRYQKNYGQAGDFYQQALLIKQKTGSPKSIATTLDNIAELYLEQKMYPEAQVYFFKALTIRRAIGDKDGILTTINRLSRLLLELNDITGAGTLAKEAFALSSGIHYMEQRLESTVLLTEIFKRSARYETALDYATLGLKLKDSLFNADMARAVTETETRYRTEGKERELMFASQMRVQQSRQINIQRVFIIVLAIFVCSLLVVAYFIVRLSRQRRQAKEKVEVLMKELNHRVTNSLQVIISLLELQTHSVKDAAQKSLLHDARNRVHSIGAVHKLLQSQSYTGTVDMKAFIHALTTNSNNTFREKAHLFEFIETVTDMQLETGIAIPVGLIINEWITNIFKHGLLRGDKGIIEIILAPHGEGYLLSISDNCEPWVPADAKARTGSGLFLIDALRMQLKGSLRIENHTSGNLHTITF